MEPLIEKITRLLEGNFVGSTIELEPAVPSVKIGGSLVWAGFEGHEQIERQQQMWRILRNNLSKEELSQITAILTFTPDEMSVMREP